MIFKIKFSLLCLLVIKVALPEYPLIEACSVAYIFIYLNVNSVAIEKNKKPIIRTEVKDAHSRTNKK